MFRRRGKSRVERARRTKILIEGASELRRELARRVSERREVLVVDEPRGALVMVKSRESAKNGLFYIGELLVTEAKVQVEGCIGIGIVAGDDSEAASDLAIIDAAFNAALGESTEWESLLLEEETRIRRREADEAARIERTRVAFESMDRG
jgi:alpha-D-ribose 1-methylphosphonate 5-triphosphate synthase subunit PhnG